MKESKGDKPLFSIVIPAYNEEGAIKDLIEEVFCIFKEWGKHLEVIVVNDGSTDLTPKKIKETDAKLVSFDKNYGQSSALDAGIKLASGNYIVTIDGDGQNDPSDIPKMFKKMKEKNVDLICGKRKNRKSKKTIKIGARLASKVRKLILDDEITDSGCTLKIFEKDLAKDLDLFRGMHRFIPALAKIKGYKVGEISVNHRVRKSGKTKYNCLKYFPGTIGLLTVWRIKSNKKNRKSFSPMFCALIIFLSITILNIFHPEIENFPLLMLSLVAFLGFFLIGYLVEKDFKKYYNYKPEYKVKNK